MVTKNFLVAALVAAPITATAQGLHFGAIETGDHVATVTTGAEHGLFLGMGYSRALTLGDRMIVVGGDVALQWAEVDANDFRVGAGALAAIVESASWKLVGGLQSSLRGTQNAMARMISVGLDASLVGGYYGERWYGALEAGMAWAPLTYIAHDDAYRMQVFEARDGWYSNAATTWHYGVQTGVALGGNDLILRGGRLHDISGAPALLPFYASLGYARRW